MADRVGARYPENVYIIHDANASVQFVSITKSLFFSKRKDLNIGLLLIKYLNKKELKGVLAHEFGHFTQSTMTINSWVFVSNVLLERSLMNREKDKNVVAKMSGLGGIYGLLNALVMGYIQIVEKQFARQYESVNISYLKLSKEMEYHADLYEVNVTDVSTFIDSSVKIEYINIYFQYLTQMYQHTVNDDDLNIEVYKDLDLYIQHKQGDYFEYQIGGGFVVNQQKYLDHYNEQIVFEHPASTHPHSLLRMQHVKKHKGDLMSEETDVSYLMLRNTKKYEQFFLKALFNEKVTHNELPEEKQREKFEARYHKYKSLIDHNKYEDILFGYQQEAVEFVKYADIDVSGITYADIFNAEIETLFEKHRLAENNKQALEYITSPESTIKQFVFREKIIYESEFSYYQQEIEKDMENTFEVIKKKLNLSLAFLYKQAAGKGEIKQLEKKANQVFSFRQKFLEIEGLMDELVFVIQNYVRFDNKEEFRKSYVNIENAYVKLCEKYLPFIESEFSELFEEATRQQLLAHFSEEHNYIHYKNSFSYGYTPKIEEIGEIVIQFKNELLAKAYELCRDNINWMRELCFTDKKSVSDVPAGLPDSVPQ